MDLNEFQALSSRTDNTSSDREQSLLISLLGMAGETGTLLAEYKKKLRDGNSYNLFEQRTAEDLGDLLWYVSNIATVLEIPLEDVARKNLAKNNDRWPTKDGERKRVQYDRKFPAHERFPRKMTVEFTKSTKNVNKVQMIYNGKELGDPLSDNAYEDDFYKYHDCFHLACVAVLGWSPVIRRLMDLKRKSDSEVDEVEDGARAAVFEECISQYVFNYAEVHSFLLDVDTLDYELLKTIRDLIRGREVDSRSLRDWENTIFQAYDVWRKLRDNNGGIVDLDLDRATITCRASNSK